MNGEQPKKPYFWPALFLTAFVLGAVLWGVWMYNIIRKTRSERENSFFVPQTAQPIGDGTNAPVTRTN